MSRNQARLKVAAAVAALRVRQCLADGKPHEVRELRAICAKVGAAYPRVMAALERDGFPMFYEQTPDGHFRWKMTNGQQAQMARDQKLLRQFGEDCNKARGTNALTAAIPHDAKLREVALLNEADAFHSGQKLGMALVDIVAALT